LHSSHRLHLERQGRGYAIREEVDIPALNKARIYPSLACQQCGEKLMEILGRTAEGKVLCKECFAKSIC
jgi:formylmethanofuran dehydrogenase subunit E